MRDNPGGEGGGLFAALKNSAATLLASGETRLELLANEFEEGKLRLVNILVILLATLFCLGMGLLVAVFFLTALFWESRLLVLGASGLFFLALGGVFYGLFKQALHPPEKIFAASLAELREDLRQLKTAAGQHENTD
jgi:uncharacterized membrane protein YqjE